MIKALLLEIDFYSESRLINKANMSKIKGHQNDQTAALIKLNLQN